MTHILEQASVAPANENLPGIKTSNFREQCINLVTVGEGVVPEAKCFYSPDGSVFIGIPVAETEDSFLVVAAAKLTIQKDRTIASNSLTSEPVMRLFKTSLKYTVNLTELSTYHYYLFLQSVGYKLTPEYFSPERQNYIDTYLENNSRIKLPPLISVTEDEYVEEEQERLEGESEHSFIPLQVSESIH